MTSNTITLDIENVKASYGKTAVLHGISLQVRPGECFGLIGLNGAGKTTLIKSILGLRNHDSGTIKVFGNERDSAESKARLAFLPERFEPPWFLSGMEFLRFSLKLYKQPFDEALIIRSAESLALDTKALSRKVQTYSKGMRQKLGLLGTALTNCPLLILDEPMSGLDPLARSRVKDMLKQIHGANRTTFLSSHILSDMDEICDRVAVLHEGAIQFTGTPAEMKRATGSDNLERAFLHFIEKKKAA